MGWKAELTLVSVIHLAGFPVRKRVTPNSNHLMVSDMTESQTHVLSFGNLTPCHYITRQHVCNTVNITMLETETKHDMLTLVPT